MCLCACVCVVGNSAVTSRIQVGGLKNVATLRGSSARRLFFVGVSAYVCVCARARRCQIVLVVYAYSISVSVCRIVLVRG